MVGYYRESQDSTRVVAQKKKKKKLDVSGKLSAPVTIPHRKRERKPGAPSIGGCMGCQGDADNTAVLPGIEPPLAGR